MEKGSEVLLCALQPRLRVPFTSAWIRLLVLPLHITGICEALVPGWQHPGSTAQLGSHIVVLQRHLLPKCHVKGISDPPFQHNDFRVVQGHGGWFKNHPMASQPLSCWVVHSQALLNFQRVAGALKALRRS